jgi:hypothetical protein
MPIPGLGALIPVKGAAPAFQQLRTLVDLQRYMPETSPIHM